MLPKISQPTFTVELPSTGEQVKMRHMLVKEEKILLMAKESDDPSDVYNAITQVLNNCMIEPVKSMSIVDLEYLFLRLRASSVSTKSRVSYRDNEDEQVYDFEIDLNQVNVKFPETKPNDTIKVSDEVSIKLKLPPAEIYGKKEFLSMTGEQAFLEILKNSIESITEGSKHFDPKMSTAEELTEFIDGLPVSSFNEIREYFSNLPRLNYEINYKNKKGTERSIVLSTLNDFFTLR